jgi:hypothetical protein
MSPDRQAQEMEPTHAPPTATGTSFRGPVADGGPRFLVVFGSVLLLIWGVIAAAASGTENALAGGSSGSGYAWVAVVFWVVAITAMYMTFARSRHGRQACAAGALLTLLVGLGLGAAWVFWWLFSGGLVGLGSCLSWKRAT